MFNLFPGFTLSRLFLTVLLRRQMAQIKTFVFLDLETTGLPFMENNKTKITEMTLLAVQSEQLVLGVVPRVQNKLSLCFNPQKLISSGSEKITGLSNDKLEHLAPFTSSTVQMINSFLEHNPMPICVVAHNGNKFDYPILRSEIAKTGQTLLEDILCIDSLAAFRQLHNQQVTELKDEPAGINPIDTTDSIPIEFRDGFDELLCKALDEYELDTDPMKKGIKRALTIQKLNETTPKRPKNMLNNNAVNLVVHQRIGNGDCLEQTSEGNGESSNGKKVKPSAKKKLPFGVSFKLVDVYQRLTNQEAVDAHQAENDVIMLAMCAATLGDRFVTWAGQNARNFADGPTMTPGRKIDV